MVLDPRNGPDWDLPRSHALPQTYVVASVPRCGSTLLCRLLWDTGLVGAPKEYLNPMQVRDWEARLAPSVLTRLRHEALRGPAVGLAGRLPWSQARLEAYLARVRDHRSAADGRFGLKVHWHHFERWFVATGYAPDVVLGPVRWVQIVREDKVAQAVSWARALQTGQWASYQQAWRPPGYSHRAIAGRLSAIGAGEAAWAAWFAARGITPLQVTYEDLVADRQRVVRRVLAHLAVPGADRAEVPEPALARQADEVSAAWVARFRAGER